MAFTPVSLTDIPSKLTSNFWKSNDISERSRQKGLQYAFESYIHDIICLVNVDEELIKIEAKAYRFQCKTQTPHVLSIHVKDKEIKEQ